MSIPEDLPDDPTQLAAIIADETQPPQRRNRALAKLTPIIERIARRAAAAWGLPPQLIQDLVGEAPTYIWERIKLYDPGKGRFTSWCLVVLGRRGQDLRIQVGRRPDGPARAGNLGSAGNILENVPCPTDADDPATAVLLERMRRLRTVLDRLAGELLRSSHGGDYFAVLLLRLRLGMARRVGLHLGQAGLPGPETMSGLIAWCLPWRPAEELLRFRPGWPALAVVWDSLRSSLDQPPYWLTGPDLCTSLTRLNGGGPAITPDVWNHWVNRAKAAARSKTPPCEWEELFAPLLTDRQTGGPASSSCGEAP